MNYRSSAEPNIEYRPRRKLCPKTLSRLWPEVGFMGRDTNLAYLTIKDVCFNDPILDLRGVESSKPEDHFFRGNVS